MCSSNLSDTANMSRHGSTLCSPTAEKNSLPFPYPRPERAQHSLQTSCRINQSNSRKKSRFTATLFLFDMRGLIT